MRSLSDTITRLAAARQNFQATTGTADRLVDMPSFGPNPGQLKARIYVPDALDAGAPLVVVLHGCTQTAAGYDHGSGWSALADRHGFALLYPEQQSANNFNLCFNWFLAEDIRRDSGEAMSIRQMVDQMVRDHALDPGRVFVTGLSAGGAMTSVMLATYPEVFAGGAIIAGLPYGSATTMPQALDRMRGVGSPGGADLGALIRNASPHDGPWPTVSIWHGGGDHTVVPANMAAIVDQWRAVHDLPSAPSTTDTIDGHARRVWRDGAGRACIEAIAIAGMAHGTPIDPRGADGVGAAGPHMLDVGIASSERIIDFWGIGGAWDGQVAPKPHPAPSTAKPAQPAPSSSQAGVAKVIDDALRAAGLMR
ncbi:hypothetical protein EAH79_13880 [Sphingomonas koreensis]|nr:hypothetical protein EAH79_13880 [Sphingomonas koreensis]